jgi:hypothetical protein
LITARIKMISPNDNIFDLMQEVATPEELLSFETALVDAGFKGFTVAPTTAVSTPAATQAQSTGEVAVAPDVAQPGQLYKRFQSAVLEVEPRQDGKSKVSFYGADIKPPMNDFPYVTNVYKTETWAKKFEGIAPFTPAHFSVPARYSIVCDVEVRYGDKRNQAGNLYRNISAITPSPGVAPQEVTTYELPEAEQTNPEDIPF